MAPGALIADLARGGVITLVVATGAWLIAVLLGLALAILRDLGWWGMRWSVSSLVLGLRSVPQLIALYLLYFGLGAVGLNLNPLLAAIVALGVVEAGFTAEYYRAGLLTDPEAQREAAPSLGLSRFGALRLVVLPQVVPFMFAPLLNAYVGSLKAAVIASAIAAPEILYRAQST
jgi:His/Glu/Gln/Arg/opine family amino acid ABC transporter permease subunit